MDDILKRLKTPAVGMIVIAVLDVVLAIAVIVSGLLSPTLNMPDDTLRNAYYIGIGLRYAYGFFSLVFGPIIILGSLKMMKGQNIKQAKTAAVLSLLPVTCCSVPLGIIFGIWALVVLRKPEVAAYFAGDHNQSPPSFPQ